MQGAGQHNQCGKGSVESGEFEPGKRGAGSWEVWSWGRVEMGECGARDAWSRGSVERSVDGGSGKRGGKRNRTEPHRGRTETNRKHDSWIAPESGTLLNLPLTMNQPSCQG